MSCTQLPSTRTATSVRLRDWSSASPVVVTSSGSAKRSSRRHMEAPLGRSRQFLIELAHEHAARQLRSDQPAFAIARE